MNTWKVKTQAGEISVSAQTASTTACGDLIFSENNGVLKMAFASGTWVTCEMVEVARQGYR